MGNVGAVMQKTRAGVIALTNKTDYYPFGMPMPNRQTTDGNYRYAFQGQEKDPETGMEAFELRLWDGRLGRWLTVDPYHEFFSPYVGMGNNPISLTDPDGGSTEGGDDPPIDWKLVNELMPIAEKYAVPSPSRSSNPSHISNGVDSHLITVFGQNADYGALGSTTNGFLSLPQDFGDWNTDGSDGRRWIGCMACHADNGAYRTLAYNSPSRYAGLSIAATLDLVLPGAFIPDSYSMTVGQWMTEAEYNTFKVTGMIPRSNVLANGSSGFNDINLTHYVEFSVHPSILKLKDANKGWYNVIPNNRILQKLYKTKGLTMPPPRATNIKLIKKR